MSDGDRAWSWGDERMHLRELQEGAGREFWGKMSAKGDAKATAAAAASSSVSNACMAGEGAQTWVGCGVLWRF